MANSDLPVRSDGAVLADLGVRAERARINRNLSQLELAQRAGVGKRTIERFEAGESTTTLNLVRILRALDVLEALSQVFPDPAPSPMAQLRDARKERRRASPRPAGAEGPGRGRPARPTRGGFPWGEPEPPS